MSYGSKLLEGGSLGDYIEEHYRGRGNEGAY